MPVPFARTASQTRPTFSRDFAGLKTLDHGAGPSITFTRASNATFFNASGVLQTASNDQPRFDHDPATGASRGLLIEEARTNLLERSAEFDNAYWTKGGTTVSANVATAPDGTTSAERLVETTDNAAHTSWRAISVTSGTSYTFSVFAKAGTSSILMLTLGDNAFGTPVPRAWFNLSTGAVGSTVGSPSATSIQSVGNGWYRCSITKAATSTATDNFYISITNADGAFAIYTGSTSNNFLIWGAQLEAGAFPTSYIPTTTAAATRSADSAVVTPISSFYNQAEGTLFAEATTAAFAAYRYLASFSNGTSLVDRNFDMSKSASNTFEGFINAASAAQASLATGQTWLSGINKSIMAARTDDVATSQNGAAVLADTSATIPTNLDRLSIGRRPDGSIYLNGHIRKIAYYPRRLSNALLQQLTT